MHLIRRRSFPVSLFSKNSKRTDTFNFGVLFFDFYRVQGSAELGDGLVVEKFDWMTVFVPPTS